MRHLWLTFIFVLGFGSTGLSSELNIEEIFRLVDDNCAGNDNGQITKFNTGDFKPSSVMAKLRSIDKNASGVDCSDQRVYSGSQKEAVRNFRSFIRSQKHDARRCLNEVLSPAQMEEFIEIVQSQDTIGVFSSMFANGDNSEGCDYYNFWIYRNNGVLVKLTFNYTD